MFERITILFLKAVIGLFVAAFIAGAGIMVWLAWANPGGVALWERGVYLVIAYMALLTMDLWLPDLRRS